MRILIAGGNGFIGSHLTATLRAAGHHVIETRRRATDPNCHIQLDFRSATEPGVWEPHLGGVEVVVNAVGIIREHRDQTFERIHTLAPQALFAACARAGVRRVVQISALGADTAHTAYFSTKRAADDFLAGLPLDWVIVRPTLVFGAGGTSARLFALLASLPVVPLTGRGEQRVQPIHVHDVVRALQALIEHPAPLRRILPLAGPRPLSMRAFLGELRASLGLAPARYLPIPMRIVRIGAHIAQLSRRSLLDADTLSMLERGNTADPSATRELLGRAPKDVREFVDSDERARMRRDAQLSWLLPLLRVSIAAVWIWTGIVSLGVYPTHQSYDLLARVGVPAALAPWMLYGAGLLDLLIGIAVLVLERRRGLWLAQLALIVGYTAIITVKLPEFWLHPYGPVLKNLPMLAAIYMLYVLETDARTKS